LLQEVLLTPLTSPVPAPAGCNDDGFEELNVNGPDHANAMTILQCFRAPARSGMAGTVWLFAEKKRKKRKKLSLFVRVCYVGLV
jgi:hypothetical protein